MAKRRRASAIVSTPLEDHVPVNWLVVGTREWLEGAWYPGALEESQKVVVSTSGDLADVKAFLDSRPKIGVDTETTGPVIKGDKNYSMNPINPDTRMVLLQMGDERTVFLIEPKLAVEFRYWLESDRFLKLLHNAIYDFKWLLVKHGIHLNRIYCSMLAEQALSAGLYSWKVGLADTVRRYPPHFMINKSVRDEFILLDHEGKKLTRKAGYYSARDIVLLFPVMREQVVKIKQHKLQATLQDEFDVIYPTAEMEIEGLNLSLPIMRQIIEYWNQREIDLSEEIFTLMGQEMAHKGNITDKLIPEISEIFNLQSNAAKLKALRAIDIDLDNIKRDSLKDASKDESFSPRQRLIAKQLAEFSSVTKMKTTYGANMVEKINPHTHRWHPRIRQLGSGEEEGRSEDKSTIATGRFSSDAQQFPKTKELFAPVLNAEEIKHVMAQYGDVIAALQQKAQAAA